jgi:hypothetical protein
MNTLSDLRSTLDEHAEQVPDGEGVARAAAVRHRVSVVRRRRRAVGAGVLSLALLVGGAATLADRGHHSDALPSAPSVLGVKAPTTMTSLGYTYRTDGSSDVISGQGSVDVERSTEPRLVSWTTDRSATVRLKLPDGEYWTSTTSDFHDFVVIPPGDGGTLRVSTTAGRVGLASYDVTDPQGELVGDFGDFRREVAGLRLVGGLVSHTKKVSGWSRLTGASGMVKVSVLCTGAPPGSMIHISLAGSELTSGCDTPSFDPGSNVIGSTSTGHLGRFGRFRAWVSGPDGSKPLVTGTDDRVEMGVGLYGPEDSTQVGGGPMDRTIEYGGHTWRLAGTRQSSGSPLRFRVDPESPAIVEVGMRITSSKPTYLHLLASGMPLQESGFSGKGGGASGPYWAPAGADVRVTRSTPGALGVGIYTRTD